jgi:hypothetical protein
MNMGKGGKVCRRMPHGAKNGCPHEAYSRYPKRREFTWYSPNGNNGFRPDQAFLHPQLMRRLRKVRHVWGSDGSKHRDALCDHAALVVDIDEN